jgi:hypothetical protein
VTTDLSELHKDVATTVDESVSSGRMVNVSLIAEKLRHRHEHLNMALEDVEVMVMQCAQRRQFPMEFDGSANGAVFSAQRTGAENGGQLRSGALR